MTIFVKDPAATLEYAIDWTAGYLGSLTITASEWAVAPAGVDALSVMANRIDAGRTIATLSGGQAGFLYQIANKVIFSDGNSDERMLVVRVESR